MLIKELLSGSVKETKDIASKIGNSLKGGECIELISDLGGGKTTFVKGLVKSAGSKDLVTSPTFTISKHYKTPKFDILHYDFYRLTDAGLMGYDIEESIQNSKTVVVIEWSEVIKHVLPRARLIIEIKAISQNKRQFTFTCSNNLSYLIDKL
jgi:tRNA threonylcarbamoyladenosine biosynthesis protein TsaE